MTGIGLYTRALAAALEQEGVTVVRVGARRSGELPRKVGSRSLYILGEAPKVLAHEPSPLFHALSNFNLPLVRVPGKRLVLTVHDLIPLLFPSTVSKAFRWQFFLWLSRSLQLADQVICVSQTTRTDLLAHFQVDPDRVAVVYNGADHVDAVPALGVAGRAQLEGFDLPNAFVLYAGAFDARKNIEAVVHACSMLKAQGRATTLVLMGQPWFGSSAIERQIDARRREGLDVRVLGYQSASMFYAVMRKATVLAFPSRYEGFGLPPLEAMRLGTPVLISDRGALPEICGDAAVQIDPDDPSALAAALDRLLHSPAEQARRSEAGRTRASQFTWRQAASQTAEVYREALRRG